MKADASKVMSDPQLFTREEYYRLGELGVFDDMRVELIEGRIIEMPPQSNLHALTIKLVEDALNAAFGNAFWVRVQMPLDLRPRSTPDPDLSVIAGAPRTHTGLANPTAALLVVEVSDSSLSYDRADKASLYAVSGIADYWIVNLVDRAVEIHHDPQPDASAPHGASYASVTTLSAPDVVSPLAAPAAQIAVADLLP
jgi:Uma2 family endonuclease